MTKVKETAKNPNSNAKDVARRILKHENTSLFFVLLALIAIVAFATGRLSITRANMANVMLQS